MALTRQFGFRALGPGGETHKAVTNIFQATLVPASWCRYTIQGRRRTLPRPGRASSTNRGLEFGVGNPRSCLATTNSS